jgi:hypothetical protein
MWACKNNFHIQVRLFPLFFFQPRTHKNWNWDSKIGGGLLIANHLDQSVWWANQKHWAAVRSYLLHSFLFCRCIMLLHSLLATANSVLMPSQNHFPEPNRHILTCLHLFVLCRMIICILHSLLLSAGAQFCCALCTSHCKVCNYAEPKLFFQS